MAVAKGFLERSMPVILAYSAKALAINWMLGMEDAAWDAKDVACPVDDMKVTDCSRSFVQRKVCVERER